MRNKINKFLHRHFDKIETSAYSGGGYRVSYWKRLGEALMPIVMFALIILGALFSKGCVLTKGIGQHGWIGVAVIVTDTVYDKLEDTMEDSENLPETEGRR
jgi:hypothetical protein